MTNEEITIELTRHDQAIKSAHHRLEKCENFQKDINALAMSVRDLAGSVNRMCEEQKEQGTRLSRLEQEPADEYKYYKRLAFGCVISVVIGTIIGYFI